MPTIKTTYPFDDWFAQGKLRIVRGKDFVINHLSMAQQIRNAATKRGIKVSVKAFLGGKALDIAVRR